MPYNLRHLRVFLAVTETHSVTRAAEICFVSQPAVTQALGKIASLAGAALFARTPQGLYATEAGETLARRVRRAFAYLDPALAEVAPRLNVTVTRAQLNALIAVTETQNFTLAAKRLGLAQPTVHRAVSQLESEAERPLFERNSFGIVATRTASALAQAARLAFAELAQADADLAEAMKRETGRIVVGAMPLSRACVLPDAIVAFRALGRTIPVDVLEGDYDDLLAGLRRGETDFLIGALRDPAPIGDIVQEELFSDSVVLVAGPGHPLVRSAGNNKLLQPTFEALAEYPFVVAPEGTPIRGHFNRIFEDAGLAAPSRLVETRSVILMRELLEKSDHLGCVSKRQAEAEIAHGLMVALPFELPGSERPIGLTLRAGFLPTVAQALFLRLLRDKAASLPGSE
ncbi:LysR family transcriptional regulator [Martelella lutilitoris]|uniref:LysR family transcriptional regulator n=1 Tax=Martelella lutilitoris TaxID=2583532 RepID=A0A7T7HKD5_9HYPH|nr:LysR family transcriptional regulator [Martelella lutilitoris]QQM30732.1 LysR family transcriptional regulator [Martelella lutilitoris]